ncbi:helix-turn-helix domain-containing protein [Terasakiella sp.]|uniref:helix-turn-helix domain-containing protein n=1 Tax=Terasakiella sp. TaxID=2034861 RepID=UPI003AA8317C
MKLNFREFRNKAGFTIEEAAAKMGISPSQVSRIESGTSDTTLRRMQEFAELYGCAASDLVTSPKEFSDIEYETLKAVMLGVEQLINDETMMLTPDRKVELTLSLFKMENERLGEDPDGKVDLSRYQSIIQALA